LQAQVLLKLVEINGNIQELLRRTLPPAEIVEYSADIPNLPVTTPEKFDELNEWLEATENTTTLVI